MLHLFACFDHIITFSTRQERVVKLLFITDYH